MTITATDDVETPGLAARLVTAPCLSAAESARRSLDDWLGEIAPDLGAAIGGLLAEFPTAGTVLAGIAESSPYLFDLLKADAARAVRLLRCDPERHLSHLIANAAATIAAGDDEAEVSRLLRSMKSEAALLIALCDIGGVWPVMRVTAALTALADAAVQLALRYLLQRESARGRLTAAGGEIEEGSGVVVLAMGKMGAGELNYSSDIDLIVLFDPEVGAVAEGIEIQPFYVRLTQALARLLQQRTTEGYVFRVDLRLRPDPASTPVAISTAAALYYYEREGRTWERAAMIKARPCAGDARVARDFAAAIAPFIWRKHLDFAALSDVHDMKRQMQAFKGHGEIAVEGHNVKIGRGGIREIEFFAQTQQLIAGGRHPELRVRPTLEALAVLAASGWITPEAKSELSAAYEFLRRVEHRLQMVADEQTHTLPETSDGVERFSRFLGYARGDDFAGELLRHLNSVQSHYSRLFEGAPPSVPSQPVVDYGAGAEDGRLLEHLAAQGFKKPKMVAASLAAWLRGDYRALRVEATRHAFEAFVPALLTGLAQAEDPDAAIVAFDRFLAALHRGARLIGLLSQNPDLVGLLALILGAAPRLGDMLARQPQIIDGLVDPRFFGPMPDRRELSGRLTSHLADAGSYEEFLDRLRLFGQESLFLIGTRILSGTVSAQQAGAAFADTAEGIARTVHRLVAAQFAAQYGTIKDQQTAILAMGKLGSREMTAASDLDLILIYDFDPDHPDSDGGRSLHGGQYFARLTQRLVSAFTTRTNFGVLYEIDLRLRPSGRAGPVASRLDAFASYQEREAWTWEHMALTRARVVSAPPALRERIEAVIRQVLMRQRDQDLVASDVLEMRRAIGEEKGERDIWDLKYAAGGLVDIEFAAQYLQLVHAAERPEILSVSTLQVIENALKLGLLPAATADVLRTAGRLYQDLTQILRLCVSEKFTPTAAGDDLLRMLARAGDAPDFSALEARVRDTELDVREIFLDLLQRRG